MRRKFSDQDHGAALRYYAGGASSVMTDIDGEGLDLLLSGKKVRLELDSQ